MADIPSAFNILDSNTCQFQSEVDKKYETNSTNSTNRANDYNNHHQSPSGDIKGIDNRLQLSKTGYRLEKENFIGSNCSNGSSSDDDSDDDDSEKTGFGDFITNSLRRIHPNMILFIVSFMLALFIVALLRPIMDGLMPLFVIILTTLFMIIFINWNGTNLTGSVSPVTNPIPPHLGLGGVSLENRYPYNNRR